MMEEADLVIVINEKEKWPEYVKEGDTVVFWDIKDGGEEAAAQILSQVRQKVEELVREIG